MLPANRAVLLDLELFGHRPLVLGRRVIRAVAVSARHFDEVAHWIIAWGAGKYAESRFCPEP
jgi:hypothetical protein